MEYLTTTEIAAKWGISRRRVTMFCDEGRINGAVQRGNRWWIPKGADKPADGRSVRYSGRDKNQNE